MLLDEAPSRSAPAASPDVAQTAAPGGDAPEADRLRELAFWYRVFAERAANPTIEEARLRTAEALEREASRQQPVHHVYGKAPDAETAGARRLDPRTRLLLEGPILPTLLRLAWPNIAVMLVMASTGLIETWWVSRLGTDALAGIALVFPLYMMMQMLSAGAMGGGISSAIARALGGGRRDDADALVLHAILINLAIGIGCSVLVFVFGPALYRALGGDGASLDAALAYSNVVFAGTALVWLMNALASVIRGGGNMWLPSVSICAGVVLLVPLSPCLIFGFGPFPALGIAGAGAAVVITTALTALALGWYIAADRSVARFRWARLRWSLFADILRVGAIASISTFQTNLTVLLTTALVGVAAGPAAIAGYGTGNRLEFLLVPLVFGLGAPLVALVGTNIGAGQKERALKIALIGGAIAFVLSEMIGLGAAIWPTAWLGLFDNDPRMLAAGTAYLRHVGPAFGFFGLGLSLYFASQGAGRLLWPLSAGCVRLVTAIGGGWLAYSLTSEIDAVFLALAAALVTYGVMLSVAVASGVWFWRPIAAVFATGSLYRNGVRINDKPGDC